MTDIQIIDARKKKLQSNQSFSSFEDQKQDPIQKSIPFIPSVPSQQKKQMNKKLQYSTDNTQQKNNIKLKTDEQIFSDFENDQDEINCEQSYRKLRKLKETFDMEKRTEDRQKQAQDKMIKTLLLEIDDLKVKNTYLKQENERVRRDLEEMRNINESILSQQKTMREVCLNEKKQRIQELLKQTGKLKKSAQSLKESLESSQKISQKLQKQNKELIQEIQNSQWKQNFAGLFVDMFAKITDQLESEWSLKKKVQISWKINKNLIHKAMNMGIKPPKIEKNTGVDNTYFTITQKNKGSHKSFTKQQQQNDNN